ncbi:DNA repair protein RadA, partial [Frankia sp. AgKG'84/4]|nr:DNA repair protein RadA [Frankia sp. AgKG'84/4]
VGGVPRRLAAAARLGFRRALVPTGSGTVVEGMTVTEVPDLVGAIARMYET